MRIITGLRRQLWIIMRSLLMTTDTPIHLRGTRGSLKYKKDLDSDCRLDYLKEFIRGMNYFDNLHCFVEAKATQTSSVNSGITALTEKEALIPAFTYSLQNSIIHLGL